MLYIYSKTCNGGSVNDCLTCSIIKNRILNGSTPSACICDDGGMLTQVLSVNNAILLG